MAAAPAKPPGPRDGGWLSRPVLLAVERVARGRAHRVPLVAAGATLVFVAAVMSTMMIGRGEDAPEEACLGTNDDEDYCDDRGDAAPVVSYSGVLWPERAVFIALGTPCGVLWFVTILLSHASLLRLADAAWARRRGGRETTTTTSGAFDGRATNDDHRPSSSSSSPSAANAAPTPTPTPTHRPSIPALRKMEPLALVAGPCFLLVVWVSLGDPWPGYFVHGAAAFVFFICGMCNVWLTSSAMATVTSLATSTGETVGSGALAAVTATIEEGNSSDTSDNAATGSVTGGGGPETPWPSATFERGRRFKRVVLFGLLGAMVPVAIVWGLMMYELGKEEHMIAPVQYLWIVCMTLGNGACWVEISEAEREAPGEEEEEAAEGAGASNAV